MNQNSSGCGSSDRGPPKNAGGFAASEHRYLAFFGPSALMSNWLKYRPKAPYFTHNYQLRVGHVYFKVSNVYIAPRRICA